MTTFPQAPPPGLTVGGYTMRARLGEGGMGVVHLGQRPGQRPVAIKVLRPHIVGDHEARQRLAREVNSLERIRSPRVAEIVDADPWGEIPYVATRYVPGHTLHEYVRHEGPLTGPDLVWFATCVAEALAAVHAVGVLHRDVKPSNVIMEGRTPILIDFGLARVADDARLTMTGWLLGTPGYLSPEILHGDDASAASDVHSWAATVAFAGLGRAPFGVGPSMAVMDRVRRGEHDLAGMSPQVRAILEEALAPDPSRRPDLDELLDWLEELAPTAPSGRSRGGATAAGATEATPATMPVAAAAFPDAVAPTHVAEPQSGRTWVLGEEHTEAVAPQEGPWPQAQPYGYDYGYGYRPQAIERASAGERLRRTLLCFAGAGVVVAGVVAAPYVTLLVLTLGVWVLRSGSLAASSVGTRRQVRGARWYDGPALLVCTPWHVVRALPGTIVLLLWGLGWAAAAALVCFAASISLTSSLAVVGAALTLSLWWGPGGRRVRSPVRRGVVVASRRPAPWFVALLVVAACVAGLSAAATSSGTSWAPDDAAPLSGVRTPAWL